MLFDCIVLPVCVLLEGEGYLCSLTNKTVISQYNFTQPIRAARFSPDGK